MELPLYIVDAFSPRIFGGNPAAVSVLPKWLPDQVLASIAAENNQSETAFLVGRAGRYTLRWFTPTFEIDLCGHGTLASAFVVFTFLEPDSSTVTFESKSGPLTVERTGSLLSMNFPSRPGVKEHCPSALRTGLDIAPQEVYLARDYLVIVESEDEVRRCNPRYELLQDLPSLGIIVSSKGTDCDFVSRAFFPTDNIKEDPVTGSAHCTLIPYWSARLQKKKLFARQISARGGELLCDDLGERVKIAGECALYSIGKVFLSGTGQENGRDG